MYVFLYVFIPLFLPRLALSFFIEVFRYFCIYLFL